MKNILAMMLLFLSLLCGCFEQRSETIQKESVSYLAFGGNTGSAVFDVYSDQQPNPNTIYLKARVEKGVRYSLQPGSYRVVVYKGGYPVSDRKLFIGDGQILEINVP